MKKQKRKAKDYEFDYLTIGFMLFLVVVSGLIGYELKSEDIRDVVSPKQYDGCWASITDGSGDWVCVNVEDMSYERALDVCQHEVGHEIFAESLEVMNDTQINKLFDIIDYVNQK